MKRFAVVVLGSLLVVAVSCKKEYTCECEVAYVGKKIYDFGKEKKKNAEAACSDIERSSYGRATCSLK